MNLAHLCVPPLEYTPVSRISNFRFIGNCTKKMSVYNLGNARTEGSQVDTSVCVERYQFRLCSVSPLEDLLATTDDYQFYCLIN
ncbi:hypothetical protein Hdeb2414_s0024g00646301 [Helianthus debilis subsp. tardiflorus]